MYDLVKEMQSQNRFVLTTNFENLAQSSRRLRGDFEIFQTRSPIRNTWASRCNFHREDRQNGLYGEVANAHRRRFQPELTLHMRIAESQVIQRDPRPR